ncbi:hypothetical protein V8J88_04055 [Massilia sp. W12]|uniref:hypothetical protein n=1 Tax=Massilia sp. W12 TaxID=3126507 RepID=UPI0030D5A79A
MDKNRNHNASWRWPAMTAAVFCAALVLHPDRVNAEDTQARQKPKMDCAQRGMPKPDLRVMLGLDEKLAQQVDGILRENHEKHMALPHAGHEAHLALQAETDARLARLLTQEQLQRLQRNLPLPPPAGMPEEMPFAPDDLY